MVSKNNSSLPSKHWISRHTLPFHFGCDIFHPNHAEPMTLLAEWSGRRLTRLSIPSPLGLDEADSVDEVDSSAPATSSCVTSSLSCSRLETLSGELSTDPSQVWEAGIELLQMGLEHFHQGVSQPIPWEYFHLDHCTQFQKEVLHACYEIPMGETRSYQDLGRLVGRPLAARAVGQVMAKNRIPLLIPCHRVLASGAKIGGFSAPGGLDTKRQLLGFEAGLRKLASNASLA